MLRSLYSRAAARLSRPGPARRLGLAALVFFTLKGLVWLGVAAAAVYWAQ